MHDRSLATRRAPGERAPRTPAPRTPSSRQASRFTIGVLAVGTALLLAACANNASASPTGGETPASSPSATVTGEAIDHATGTTDVVFRFEQGGGFVPMGFFATQAPQFTLYGDGTVIFRDVTAPFPPNDTIGVQQPYLTAKLTEPEVQAFLRFALADSGLGIARAQYNPGNVADAPTSTFTVNAGGLAKTVSAEALGFENPQSPDAPILKAMAALAERLGTFATSVSGEVVWVPDRWRGVLTPDAFNPPAAWPWPELTPADFVQPADPNAPQFPMHTLTSAQVAALGLTGIDGGFASLALRDPDGKTWNLALRPILPDESR